WLRDDARLFLQIRNSIDGEVISLINHCEYVKELLDYLEFLYSGKGNISRIYEACKNFYRAEQQDNSLAAYFMSFKRTFKELNTLLPLSPDVKVQQAQREQMAIMSFLADFNSQFETAKSQVLSSVEIPSLHKAFTRILRIDNSTSAATNFQSQSAFVSHNFGKAIGLRNNLRNEGPNGQRNQDIGSIVCYYCHELGHTKRTCRKLHNKSQKSHSARVVVTTTVPALSE